MELTDEDIASCPKCKSKVLSIEDCPTYPNGAMMYRCYPACGNATQYYCANDDCDWLYVDGLNAMSPRYDGNLRRHPKWIKDNPPPVT